MAEILRAIPDEEVKRLQRGMNKHFLAFDWFASDGLAYNYTVLGLFKSVQAMLGAHY